MGKLVDLIEGLLHGEVGGRDLVRRTSPPIGAGALALVILGLGAVYGACMALYGLRWGTEYGLVHLLAVTLKVPALFLLTLAVTCPSLYVFSALAGSSLRFPQVARLLCAATALALAVLASFAPVTAFFTFSTKSHPFMQLVNAALFTVSGLVGMRFVWNRLAEALADGDGHAQPGFARAGPFAGRPAWVVLAWFVIYATVAAQMAWILRPFVGTPHMPQELFRRTEGNIFQGIAQALKYLD